MGLFEPLEEFKSEDLPQKKTPNWKLIGPGAVLVGLSIGAGEIIIWPQIVAEYGSSMIWAAVFGVFLQMWINLEIGRWTVATGETVYTAFSRVWRGFAVLFIMLTILGWIVPGWARASGAALKALVGLSVGADWQQNPAWYWSDTFWTTLTFAGVALVLFGPKLIYKSVERTIEALVVIVVVGLTIVTIGVSSPAVWTNLGQGLINVGHIDQNMDVKKFFIALVFAGAGGTANLFYTFYLRDKQIGMGSRVPSMQNPLRGRAEKIPAGGFRYPDNAQNRRCFRQWWRFVVIDQIGFFWVLNSFTMLLFIFGALAVLHADGIVPKSETLIWDQSQVLGKEWGMPGRVLFLIVGLATLFSTQLALVDGSSRSIADILYTNFKFARKREVNWWYLVVAGSWIMVGCVLTYFLEHHIDNLAFLFNAAYMGGFAMAVYVPLTLYINWRYLPKSARPGSICTFMMIVASLVYVGFAVACIYWEIVKLLSPETGGGG